MKSLESPSQIELKARRKQMRRQRLNKSLQGLWRTLLLLGLTGALIWVCTLPDWAIRKPGQIEIEGNKYLSAQAIRAMLPITYPQSILKLQPQDIAQKLESQAPIRSAIVSRQLLPPRLTIQVKERQPIAIAQIPGASNSASNATMALLDAEGFVLPLQTYTALDRSLNTRLKVIGQPQQYRPFWHSIYQTVSHSPVKVLEIDFQNPANLILHTELGKVHCGAYSDRLPNQLRVLDRLRELHRRLRREDIDYIDLKNLDSPAIRMTKGHDTVKPSSN